MYYVQQQKALYGTLQSALIFRQFLSKTLIECGFMLNEYDTCVINETTSCKLCTIIWHVNKLKISYIKKKVVEEVIKDLNKTFRKGSLLTKTHGKVLEYLGMTLD